MADAATVRDHVSIYRHLVGARIRADWQYRTSFLMYALAQCVVSFLDFLAIAVLFTNTQLLAGWSVAEVAFLYGLSSVAFCIGDLFISEVELLHRHVRLGTFDQFLIRPLGPLFQLACHEFALRRAGKLVQALVVLAVSMVALPVDWRAASLGMVVVTIVCGTVIFGAIWVVTSTAAFWTTETREIGNAATYGGAYSAQYPMDVYPRWLQRVLVLVPLAFVSYLPATWILDRPDALGLPGWAAFAGPAVAVGAFVAARAVWRTGVRHYRSTGT